VQKAQNRTLFFEEFTKMRAKDKKCLNILTKRFIYKLVIKTRVETFPKKEVR